MKSFLDKFWLIIISLGVVFLIVIYFTQESKIDALNHRTETLNNNFQRLTTNDSTLVAEMRQIQFKEDSYIRQQDRDTNLILWFIAIIFGLFGFLSFASFSRRVNKLEKSLMEKYESQWEEIDSMKEDLEELEANLNDESSTINLNLAEGYFKDQEYDAYLFYGLLSLYYSVKYYNHCQEIDNSALTKITAESIEAEFDELNTNLKLLKKKPSINASSFYNLIENLIGIDHLKIKQYASEIYGLIDVNQNED